MNQKVGRNDPCPCGSGKKYKSCCMNKQEEPKKTYTAGGKRKFKATVLNAGSSTQKIFQQGMTPPQEASPSSPALSLLKFKMAKSDYRQKEEQAPDFPLPDASETVKPAQPEAKEIEANEAPFKPAQEDFRVENQEQTKKKKPKEST